MSTNHLLSLNFLISQEEKNLLENKLMVGWQYEEQPDFKNSTLSTALSNTCQHREKVAERIYVNCSLNKILHTQFYPCVPDIATHFYISHTHTQLASSVFAFFNRSVLYIT